MSQTTANELLNDRSYAEPATVGARTSEPRSRKNTAIALLCVATLAVGFKFIGDYAADRAIDAWAARQQAQYTAPSPLAALLLDQMQNDPEYQEAYGNVPETTEPVSLGK